MADNQVKIIIAADGSAAISGIKSVTGALGSMEKDTGGVIGKIKQHWFGLSAAATSTYLAIQKIIMPAIELGGQLSDMSKKFGVAGSELSQLSYIAKMNGVELEGVGNSMKFLSKAMSDAGDPASEAARAFNLLGVEAKTIQGMSTGQAFELMAEKFSGLEDGANKTALAMKVFGRAGADLLPMMSEGAEGIRRAREEAVELGLAMDDETIAQLDEYGDAIDRIGMKAKSTAGKILVSLVEAVKGAHYWLSKSNEEAAWAIQQSKIPESHMDEDVFAGGEYKVKTKVGSLGDAKAAKAAAEKALEEAEKLEAAALEHRKGKVAEYYDWEASERDKEILADYAVFLKETELEEERIQYLKGKESEFLQWELYERERVIKEEYEMRLKAELALIDIAREQKALLFESMMANTQQALGAIGANDITANVRMLGALASGEDSYTKDFERWKVLQDEKYAYMATLGASEQEWRSALAEEDLRREEMLNQQKMAMAANAFGVMGNLASGMYQLMGQKGGAAFELMKAMRIGETVMNTYSAAVGAYQAMASIPYVGPALGAAAAAAAIAFGMAQVRAITSMKPGGTGSSSGRASVPSISGTGGGEARSAVSEPAEKASPSPTVNVHIYGNVVDHDKFARELVPAITKAIGDGVA